jgi:hypothetical protein
MKAPIEITVMATKLNTLIFSLKNKVPKAIVNSGVARKSMLEIRGFVICKPKKLKSRAKKMMQAISSVLGKYFLS